MQVEMRDLRLEGAAMRFPLLSLAVQQWRHFAPEILAEVVEPAFGVDQELACSGATWAIIERLVTWISINGKARLLVELDDNDYANYQVITQNVEGREILRRRAGNARFGKYRVFANLPIRAGEFTRAIASSSFSVRPQTVEVKRSTDTSSECRKKNIPHQKKSDMFRLFFGVVVGSTNAFGLILILTAWNQFTNWALIVVSAINRNLCAFAQDGFSQRENWQSRAWNTFPILASVIVEGVWAWPGFRISRLQKSI
jgi:hypothetical protein